MAQIQNQVLSKGLFAIAAVVIAGTIGGVTFAKAAINNNGSGYGTTSEQATAAAQQFAANINADQSTFTSQVQGLSGTARQTFTTGTTVDNFDSQYNAATAAYSTSLNNAFQTFLNDVNTAANTAESKDAFIDQFNNAKAQYLNQLDAAKNQFADATSKLGDKANQAKDTFMNGYNSDRDAYSNKLEQAKNDFAATISNL